jgi:uncharacterized membrane protein
VGLRSLSALFGTATVPVAYLVGRELIGRRAGLGLAAIVAVEPMLVWYSQDARAYALLVLLSSAALLFLLRARRTGRGRDLAWWAVFSALRWRPTTSPSSRWRSRLSGCWRGCGRAGQCSQCSPALL